MRPRSQVLNPIARRTRVHLLHVELMSQARGAKDKHVQPSDLLCLVADYPLVAALLGAAREAMRTQRAASLQHGFVYLGHRYRIEAQPSGAFRVLSWATGETLVQSPPGAC